MLRLRNETGAVSPLFALVLVALATATVWYVGLVRRGAHRLKAQRAIDAGAAAAATVHAIGYDVNALANLGVLLGHALELGVLVVGGGTGLALVATGVAAPTGVDLIGRSWDVVQELYDLNDRLASLRDRLALEIVPMMAVAAGMNEARSAALPWVVGFPWGREGQPLGVGEGLAVVPRQELDARQVLLALLEHVADRADAALTAELREVLVQRLERTVEQWRAKARTARESGRRRAHEWARMLATAGGMERLERHLWEHEAMVEARTAYRAFVRSWSQLRDEYAGLPTAPTPTVVEARTRWAVRETLLGVQGFLSPGTYPAWAVAELGALAESGFGAAEGALLGLLSRLERADAPDLLRRLVARLAEGNAATDGRGIRFPVPNRLPRRPRLELRYAALVGGDGAGSVVAGEFIPWHPRELTGAAPLLPGYRTGVRPLSLHKRLRALSPMARLIDVWWRH